MSGMTNDGTQQSVSVNTVKLMNALEDLLERQQELKEKSMANGEMKISTPSKAAGANQQDKAMDKLDAQIGNIFQALYSAEDQITASVPFGDLPPDSDRPEDGGDPPPNSGTTMPEPDEPATMPVVNLLDGTPENDNLTGSDDDDYIYAYQGNDTLSGGKGNDYLSGGEGNDKLMGGEGEDFLNGETGNDTLTGGDGKDTFSFGGFSDDTGNLGKTGNDVITDFDPAEDMLDLRGLELEFDDLTITQADGNTLISWEGGSVLLDGVTDTPDESWFLADGHDVGPIPPDGGDFGFPSGRGDDGVALPEPNITEGTDGTDTLSGGDEDDNIYAKGGNDTLSGGKGWDYLNGGAGNDKLSGGDGSDFLDGDVGDDTLTGGDGNDTFAFFGESGDDVISDFTPGEDLIDLMATGLDFSDLTISQTGGDTLISWETGSVLLEGVTETVDESWFFMGRFEPMGIVVTEPAA